MMAAAEAAAAEAAGRCQRQPPLILGVTVLTSLEARDLTDMGVISFTVAEHVERLAQMAIAAGLRGLVSSPVELPRLRKLVPPEMQLVTPGIRAADAAPDDQKRTLSAPEAIQAGANWLVIGRPVCAAPDPAAAAQAILDSIS
jgi:orotidine-5'-phosphate decarboxylase